MADVFVMCPECGVSVKLTEDSTEMKYDKGKCQHRRTPMACPAFGTLLDTMQKLARQTNL